MPTQNPRNTISTYGERPSLLVNHTLRNDLADSLRWLSVSENWISGRTAEVEFTNWGPVGSGGRQGFALFSDPIRFGDRVEVKVGQSSLIVGIVTAIEGVYEQGEPPGLVVTVSQELVRMDKSVRSRSFSELTLQDVCSAICGEHGFDLDFQTNQSIPVPSVLRQIEETDYEFLVALVEELDMYLSFNDNTVFVRQRHTAPPTTVSLNLGSSLTSYSVKADIIGVATKLEGRLYDSVTDSQLSESADVSAIAPASNRTGSGPNVANEVWGEALRALRETRLGKEGLALAVQSRFKQQARRFLLGEGECEFNAELKLGSKVSLSGLGAPFSGTAFVAALTHRFDSDFGLRTFFDTEQIKLNKDLLPESGKPAKKKSTQEAKRARPRPAKVVQVRFVSKHATRGKKTR